MTEQDPLAERKAILEEQLLNAERTVRLANVASGILAAAKGAELHVEFPGLVIHTYPHQQITEQQ